MLRITVLIDGDHLEPEDVCETLQYLLEEELPIITDGAVTNVHVYSRYRDEQDHNTSA